MKKLTVLIYILASAALFADNVKVTQIDARDLFMRQRVTAYLSVTDSNGDPVSTFSPDKLSITDSNGENLPIEEVITGDTGEEPVSFYLLIDNSGSMYDMQNGYTRIEEAKRAVRAFLSSRFDSDDRVAITEFNTLVTPLITFEDELTPETGNTLNEIDRPDTEMAYTELYGAMQLGIEELGKFAGRKAMLVLSDGENFPYFEKTGNLHPEWGEEEFGANDTLLQAQIEGITVYAINFGSKKDEGLQNISVTSGGTVYDPTDGDDLARVYEDIKERIENEVKVVFRPGVVDNNWETITVSYNNSVSTGEYHTPSLLGSAGRMSNLILLSALGGSILLFIILMLLKYEHKVKKPQVELLSGGSSPQSTVVLQNQATVIGTTGDLTVMGNPKMKGSHATVMQDKKGQFTIVSDTEVYVNNQPTKKKKLKSGDVLNIEGTTIVFDEPDDT